MGTCEKCGNGLGNCVCIDDNQAVKVDQGVGTEDGIHKAPVAVVSFAFHNDGRVEANCTPNEPEGEITMGDVMAVTSAHLLLGFGEDLIKGGTLGKMTASLVQSGASLDGLLSDEE